MTTCVIYWPGCRLAVAFIPSTTSKNRSRITLWPETKPIINEMGGSTFLYRSWVRGMFCTQRLKVLGALIKHISNRDVWRHFDKREGCYGG